MTVLIRDVIGIIAALLLLGNTAVVADPILTDTQLIGGSGYDEGEEGDAIDQTNDGGFILTGYATSSNGDFASGGYHGNGDAFLIKLNPRGLVEWGYEFGGSRSEHGTSVHQTIDGGYIVAGYTSSIDGNFSNTGYHGGSSDAFITKFNTSGIAEWTRCIGGSGDDYGFSVQQTNEGGYIVAGYTSSTDGDFSNSGYHGGRTDAFLVKVDNSGIVEWARCVGGSGDNEYGHMVQLAIDGGYILGGQTTSWDGDFTDAGYHHHAIYTITGDGFVAKVNNTGTVEWTRCFGGSLNDYISDFHQVNETQFIIAGSTTSSDGTVVSAGYHSEWDAFIAEVSIDGTTHWARCIGGSGNEQGLSTTRRTDGVYLITGMTDSSNADFLNSGYHGGQDAFIAFVNESGKIEKVQCIGGSGSDSGESILQTADNGIALSGYSSSSDGDFTGADHHGSRDIFFIRIVNPIPAIGIETMISVDRGLTWEEADTPPGPNVLIGDPVLWKFLVTNTGNVPLTGIIVTEDQTILPLPNTDLDPGESMDTTFSSNALGGEHKSIASVAGYYQDQSVSDIDTTHYFGNESSVPIPEFPTIFLPLGFIFGILIVILSLRKGA